MFFWVLLLLLLVFVSFYFVGGSNKSEILNREIQKEMASGQFLYLYIRTHFGDKHSKSLNLSCLAKYSDVTWIEYVDSRN